MVELTTPQSQVNRKGGWSLSERRLRITTWDNHEICLRTIGALPAMSGSEIIPSCHRRTADGALDSDTDVGDDMAPKTFRLQLLPATTTIMVRCAPGTAVGSLVIDSNAMMLAQVGEDFFECNLNFVTTKRSSDVPATKIGTVVLVGVLNIVWLEAISVAITHRKVR